jgi:hypothetical protein
MKHGLYCDCEDCIPAWLDELYIDYDVELLTDRDDVRIDYMEDYYVRL